MRGRRHGSDHLRSRLQGRLSFRGKRGWVGCDEETALELGRCRKNTLPTRVFVPADRSGNPADGRGKRRRAGRIEEEALYRALTEKQVSRREQAWFRPNSPPTGYLKSPPTHFRSPTTPAASASVFQPIARQRPRSRGHRGTKRFPLPGLSKSRRSYWCRGLRNR